MIFKVVEA